MSSPRYIFDIDGTLVPTQHVDNDCYRQAVHQVFGTAAETLDLHGFEHVSDSGIFAEWCARTLQRPATAAEQEAVRNSFLQLLKAAYAVEPASFQPLPGAADFLHGQPPGRLALATGGWRHTARFKLHCAGLDRFKLPLSCSDDAMARTDIMRQAEQRLESGPTPIYFGDGLWDLAAARSLGWGFVGIAHGPQADALRAAGARLVATDFCQLTGQELNPITTAIKDS